MLRTLCVALVVPLVVATNNQPQCIKNTGARCISSCYSWRGPAYCKWSRCFCEDNGCAGADDICHTGANKAMTEMSGGQGYRIRNSRWPNFFLYAAQHGPLVAKRMRDEDSKQYQFVLKDPPANADPNRRPAYLMFSHYWPDAVIMILQRIACSTSGVHVGSQDMTSEELENFTLSENNTNMTLPEGYAWQEEPEDTAHLDPSEVDDHPDNTLDLGGGRRLSSRRRYYVSHTSCRQVRTPLTRYVQGNWMGMGTDPPLHWLLMYFEKAPFVFQEAYPDAQLVMLKNSQDSYLFMPTFGIYGFTGWGTHAMAGDPGTGGYWYFDPKLPTEIWDKLPSYSGRTCSVMCGEVSPDLKREFAFISAAAAPQLGLGVALLFAGAAVASLRG